MTARPEPLGMVLGLPWTTVDAWYDQGGHLNVLVPFTPADAPADVQRGLDLVRTSMMTGACDNCGARRISTGNRAERRRTAGNRPGVGVVRVLHRPGCPASERALTEAVERWQQQEGAQ